jgi:hypothetical protein
MPSNDNIASAASISGVSGNTTGSNTGAGIETGEPGWPTYNNQPILPQANASLGPYATVWYVWTAPTFTGAAGTTAEVLFSTFHSGTNFSSVVQIFTLTSGSTVSVTNLTEVTYIADERVGTNNGFGIYASASFIATTGTVYYIRVGGRNGATGNFYLLWQNFDVPTWGSCDQCAPTSVGTQLGSITVVPTGGGTSQSYSASFPAIPSLGVYQIKYCKGALAYGGSSGWLLGPSQDPLAPTCNNTTQCEAGSPIGSPWFTNSSGFQVWNGSGNKDSGGTGWSTPEICEQENQCINSGWILSCPDTISLGWVRSGSGSVTGSPFPTYQLVFNPVPSSTILADVGNSLVTPSGGGWTGNFAIQNLFGMDIPNVTATLLATGGISSPSAPITGTLYYGLSDHDSDWTFTFDAPTTTEFCTATIELTACGGTVIATLEFPLYPVISVTATLGSQTSCSPSGQTNTVAIEVNWSIIGQAYDGNPGYNLGQLGFTGGIDVVATSSPLSLGTAAGNCTGVSNVTKNIPASSFTSQPLNFDVYVLGGVGTANTTISVAMTAGSLTYPTFTEVIVIP